jgi:hypothetical protein
MAESEGFDPPEGHPSTVFKPINLLLLLNKKSAKTTDFIKLLSKLASKQTKRYNAHLHQDYTRIAPDFISCLYGS